MSSFEAENRRAKPPRIRTTAYWCFVLSAITLGACGIGVFQLLSDGVVTIRPGHEYLTGGAAEEMLIALGIVGAAFGVIGILMLHRARRLSDHLQGTASGREAR